MSQKPASLSPQEGQEGSPAGNVGSDFGQIVRGAASEIIQPFADFLRTPRALWAVHLSYYIEGVVYFGILTVLVKFLNENVGLRELHAGWVLDLLTSGITLSMFFFGGLSDRWGIRKALMVSLILLFLGRVVFASGEVLHLQAGLFSPLFWCCIAGILLVVMGYGMYQPAAYAAVKQLTDERTSALSYAMLYALMNLGSFAAGILSPIVRRASEKSLPPNGLTGVFLVYAGFCALAIVLCATVLTRKSIADAKKNLLNGGQSEKSAEQAANAGPKLFTRAWFVEHPLADARFSFFIFILIPVQTLFAHNWTTLPLYIERSFRDTSWISQNFEFFSNVNPLLIFVLTPIVAALTARSSVYRMMIIGTAVMAVPTFLLALSPNPALLFVYIFTMSVGEAMWQPRFLQYAAEIAPEGKTGLYIGVAQLPWFLTKAITGLYAGWFIERYCPKTGPQNTEFMWFFHSMVACISPVALYLARNWVGNLKTTKNG